MAPQQITKIVEETVNNLRELETRLDLVRTDLAVLCQTVGQPEAAQRVLATRGAGSVAGSPFAAALGIGIPNVGNVGFAPHIGANPWTATSPYSGVSPYAAINPLVAGITPFNAPHIGNPWSAVSPYTQPFNAAPYANAWNTPWATSAVANPYAFPR